MDTLLGFFQSLTAGTSAQRVLFVVGAGATAFMFVLGVSLLFVAATDPVRRRLNEMAGESKTGGKLVSGILRLVEPVSRYVLPTRSEERGRMQKSLEFAGFRSPNALSLFYAIKTGLALVLLLAVPLSAPWLPRFTSTQLLFLAMFAAFAGMMLPNYVLEKLVQRRQKRLRDAFPDALDMLVVCVEAGLGLTSAIQRVSTELHFSHPELAAEFAQVTAEMRAGIDRETALKGLAARTGLEDIRGLVSLLIQTLRFGTSIGDTLRVYSEEFRDKRMQRAEELAAKIGTKLIFPLVFCLFPAFFVVAVGPAVVRLLDVFRQLGQSTGQ
jgi:tight adherence protein C